MVSPTRTDSLYEQIQPLTTVMKNRFVEWFVGSALNHGTSGKVWYKGYTVAVPTMAMLDELEEDLKSQQEQIHGQMEEYILHMIMVIKQVMKIL